MFIVISIITLSISTSVESNFSEPFHLKSGYKDGNTHNPVSSSAFPGEEIFRYYNPDTVGPQIGVGDEENPNPPYTWEAAIRLSQEELNHYKSYKLVAAQFYHAEPLKHNGSLRIYNARTTKKPGGLIAEVPYSVNGTCWKRINLTESLCVDEYEELWISFQITSGDIFHEYDAPLLVDLGPAVDLKGDWANIGEGWFELQSDPFWNWNWYAEVIFEGERATLEITSISGGIGLQTTVKNNDNDSSNIAAENINVEMQIHGGVLGLLSYNIQWYRNELIAGESCTLYSGFVLGLFPIHVVVNAEAANAPTVMKEVDGYLFGPFAIII